MWYRDVVYIYVCVCYVGNLMVWMDFFVMASELGCSKLFVVPCFLGGKNNLWKIDGQIDGLIIVIPPCCEIHARYSVITDKTCGNLWAFSWLWMNLFVLVLELRCFSSLFFLDWGKHGSINGGRTFQKIWKNHAHIPSLVSYFFQYGSIFSRTRRGTSQFQNHNKRIHPKPWKFVTCVEQGGRTTNIVPYFFP